jgi:hypothetical protein
MRVSLNQRYGQRFALLHVRIPVIVNAHSG